MTYFRHRHVYVKRMFKPKVCLCQKDALDKSMFMSKVCLCQEYVYVKSMLMSKVWLCQKYAYVRSMFVSKVWSCQKYVYARSMCMSQICYYGQCMFISKVYFVFLLSWHGLFFPWRELPKLSTCNKKAASNVADKMWVFLNPRANSKNWVSSNPANAKLKALIWDLDNYSRMDYVYTCFLACVFKTNSAYLYLWLCFQKQLRVGEWGVEGGFVILVTRFIYLAAYRDHTWAPLSCSQATYAPFWMYIKGIHKGGAARTTPLFTYPAHAAYVSCTVGCTWLVCSSYAAFVKPHMVCA
jgi:hypothetical protein